MGLSCQRQPGISLSRALSRRRLETQSGTKQGGPTTWDGRYDKTTRVLFFALGLRKKNPDISTLRRAPRKERPVFSTDLIDLSMAFLAGIFYLLLRLFAGQRYIGGSVKSHCKGMFNAEGHGRMRWIMEWAPSGETLTGIPIRGREAASNLGCGAVGREG